MRTIATTLLALLAIAPGWTATPAQADDTSARPGIGAGTPVPSHADDSPSASPRTVERTRILGLTVSTAIFVGAALLFAVIVAAALLAGNDQDDRRRGIGPRL